MPSLRPPLSGRAGMTLVELVFVVAILAVAFQMTLGTLASTARAEPLQRETAAALDALRDALEEVGGQNASTVFALYNADPADDPGGAGSAPGAGFAVAGLRPLVADADGLPGRIEFPEVAGWLREDIVDRPLGMPRDLNLDGAVDPLDHAGDYRILPFRVHVEWLGLDGRDHTLSMYGSAVLD